jgi:hypothetical protein
MNLKIGIMAVLAFVGLIVVSASMLPQAQINENVDSFHQGISYKGHVEVYKIPVETGIPEKVADKDNLLVTNGKTYIRTQIGSGSAAASSSAKYISLSNDATSPDVAWVDIPTEITTNGLGRASATYAANGTGAWNQTYTWTASGAQSAQLTGLSSGGTPADNTLFATLQFASVTLATNDQLRVIWSISVS